jgi:hypothetical protein
MVVHYSAPFGQSSAARNAGGVFGFAPSAKATDRHMASASSLIKVTPQEQMAQQQLARVVNAAIAIGDPVILC